MAYIVNTVTNNKGNKMTKLYVREDTNKIYINYYVDGVRKQKSTGYDNTPENIKLVKNHIIPSLNIKIATGEIYKKKPKTFEHYGSIFLRQKSKDNNYIKMKQFYHRVEKHFKGMMIDEITRLDIKEYLMGLEIKSKNPYKTVINSVFELAVDDGVIPINPSLNIKLKTYTKTKVEFFTKEEVSLIFSNVKHEVLRVYLLIAFNTGLRSGEILGLQLGDFEEQHISIKRTRTNGVIGQGKNMRAIRKVPYPSFILDEVKRMQGRNIFLFDDIDDSKKLTYQWHKLLKATEVKKLRLYCTRHTFATLMLQDGVVSINELAGLLGHSSVKTTLDKYASAISPETLSLGKNFSVYCVDAVTVDKKDKTKAQ